MAVNKETLKNKRKVKVCKNGPYIVSGGIPLSRQTIVVDEEGWPLKWREEHNYPSRERYLLCRCGRSEEKPFCSGTHAEVDFDGTETASREPYLTQAKKTYGPTLRLTDVGKLCVHAGFCDRDDGTWNLTKNSNDEKARNTAIEEAGNCPSGRLVIWDKKTGERIEPEFEKSIGLIEEPGDISGAIWVRGGIPVESANGEQYEIRNRVTLCRCGKSNNKPLCDGSHHHQ